MKDNRRSAAVKKKRSQRASRLLLRKKTLPSAAQSSQNRNASLDTLRGIAIFLMVVDHVANFWFETRIEWDSVRLPTRLSMPLFAILMGYFISATHPFPWKRMLQVAAVSGIVNVFFYPLYERVEILASLFVCYVLVFSTSKYSPLLTLTLFLLPWDPSVQAFDYPLTLVAGCVAQGQVLRHYGWKIGLVVSVVLCLSAIYIDPVAKMTVLMVPVATGLIIGAIKHRAVDVPGLNWMGRYPLAIYLAHYLIVLWFRPR